MRHLEALQRQAVVQEAPSWLGTPFHHQGRVKGAGVDCAMLMAEVFEHSGLIPHLEIVENPDNLTQAQNASGHIFIKSYPAQWHLNQREEVLLSIVSQLGHEIPGPPLPGDVVLYQYGHCLSHAAIVIDWPRIIHAVAGVGVSRGNGEKVIIRGHRPKRHVFFSYWGPG
ncbi:MAG: NlpC/P60 family protein [Candidatus Cryosericum sp.]